MTSIEWVKNADGSQGLTWNPIRGCTRVSPGCGGPGPHGGCYAEGIAARFSGPGQPYEGIAEMRGGKAHWTGKLAFVESALDGPLRRRKPTTWFVNSMSDLFHESVPDEWIDRIFAVMAMAEKHTFQVLTKRSARTRAYLTDQHTPIRIVHASRGLDPNLDLNHQQFQRTNWPIRNVWIGVSAEDQRRADERVPDLLATPAAVRFVSAEPLLGPIDFGAMDVEHDRGFGEVDALRGIAYAGSAVKTTTRLDWVIVGGESGPNARPMHPDWARQIRDACAAAGTAYYFKQWGAFQHGSTMGRAPSLDRIVFNDGGILTDVTMPACKAEDREHGWQGRAPEMMALVGKKVAGRLLDGVEHNGMPEVRHG